jgi:ubiquinone/menaquinone biosynthesis C-methylase UbiE
MKYVKFAKYYEAIYSFKNYEAEARRVHELVSGFKLAPGNSLLDVACGTGGHLAFMRKDYVAEGLDLSEQMLAIARERLPEITFHRGDMLDFDFGRKFDVIVCLFSAIGYVKTARRLKQAVANMRRHLEPGGVLVVEPWLTPETYKPGGLHGMIVNQPELKIARMNLSAVRNGVSIIKFHCLVGTPQGIEYFTEQHELGLFTHQEYLDAFAAAGLEVQYDEKGLMDRGLYLGRSAAESQG